MTSLIAVALLLAAPASHEEELAAITAAKGQVAEPARLQRLLDASWEFGLADGPERATMLGDPRFNGGWTDLSEAAFERRRRVAHATLQAARSLDRSALSAKDQLDLDLFLRNAVLDDEGARFPEETLALDQVDGPQSSLPLTLEQAPLRTVAEAETLLQRLGRIPAYVDQLIALLQRGMAKGWVPPNVIMTKVPEQIHTLADPDPAKNPLLRPLASLPASIAPADQKRLRAAGAELLRDKVAPAALRLERFVADVYLPACRDTIAASALPDGAAWYALQVRRMTTTSLTPQQIHEIGFQEVARIRAELEKVKAEAGFQGSMAEFQKFLRTDPRFFYTDAESLVRGYRDIAKRADPGLVKLFGKLPRMPYGVVETPAEIAPTQPTARYQAGSIQASRPAVMLANTYDLAARPKWEMEALTLHEAVPGHHLQIALAFEQGELRPFRRFGGYTAFIEGWGLYAESLGYEMGFYKDPYARFGQLTYEMWRAVRLVVDTGMHALGWERQRALDYFRENAAKSERDMAVEIDRYIAWPGQALAYKLGQLTLSRLRAQAARELGASFDVRAFHDEVLGAGALPLDVLESRMAAWIASRKK
jgi:uncharacterized protein (DUF885 family)